MLYIEGERIDRTEAQPSDLERAIAAATRGFHELSSWPAHRRAALLSAIAEGIAQARERLAELIVSEARKPIQYAQAEVDRARITFSLAAEEARRLGGELVPIDAVPGGDNRVGLVRRVARGPVLAITPFNFPLNLAAHKIAPALACGASVVHKPAPETPGTALALAQIAHDAGAPAGALSVVPCAVEHAALLVEDDRLPVLSFTGSAEVGWALKARAPHKHVLLELGGNAAVILQPDANLALALPRLVAGSFAYAGQICISVQRIYAHHAIYDAFESAFVTAAREEAVVGDPRDPRVMVGPLLRTRDAERVEAWIQEAVARGARVLLGGRRQGDTVWPTVLTSVDRHAKLSCEEVFGPVVVLAAHRDLDDAIARTNDSPYGLQAGLYTEDHATLMKAFRTLRVGALIHNDVPMFRADHMPYGGTKRSGVGREGVRYAIEEMTEPRLLVMQA
jgi:glyceraldehyde-3-phosphate dehydrogenase (NADP+)